MAESKPWFDNTVFVIMADHCASSAGKRELNIDKYHLPAFIYNLKDETPQEVDKLCSQIDLFPTLFGYFNWTYETQLIGQDISKMPPKNERAFIGNYRNLGLFKNNQLLVLGDKTSANFYNWNKENNQLSPTKENPDFLKEAVGYYYSNDYYYQNDLYKIKKH